MIQPVSPKENSNFFLAKPQRKGKEYILFSFVLNSVFAPWCAII
jgi:hypothetical protein